MAKIDGSVGIAKELLLKAQKSAFLVVLVTCPWLIQLNGVLWWGRCQHHRAKLDMTDHKVDEGATTDHPTCVHTACGGIYSVIFFQEMAVRDKCLHFVSTYHAWCVSDPFCLSPAPTEMFPCRGVEQQSKGMVPLPCPECELQGTCWACCHLIISFRD